MIFKSYKPIPVQYFINKESTVNISNIGTKKMYLYKKKKGILNVTWQHISKKMYRLMSALDLEKHLINLYLQHQDDGLHNVPLRFPPIHDNCETSSLTFLTETDRSLLNTGIKANKNPLIEFFFFY